MAVHLPHLSMWLSFLQAMTIPSSQSLILTVVWLNTFLMLQKDSQGKPLWLPKLALVMTSVSDRAVLSAATQSSPSGHAYSAFQMQS